MFYIHFGRRNGALLSQDLENEWKQLYLDHYFTQQLLHTACNESLQED